MHGTMNVTNNYDHSIPKRQYGVQYDFPTWDTFAQMGEQYLNDFEGTVRLCGIN